MAAGVRHRSTAAPLALAWAVLIVYASLFPFEGWRWPPGASALQMLALPWTRYQDRFDLIANALGYGPMGLLPAVAWLRGGGSARGALALGLLLPSALSFAMESLQFLLPTRVPSRQDWLLNSAGAAAGALLAQALNATGGLDRWHRARQRWFEDHGAGAAALLMLWPAGLLFPLPVPLGVGQVWPVVQRTLDEALQDVPWAQPVADWLDALPAPQPLGLGAEWLAVTLGLLAPCLLSYAIARSPLRRVGLALGAALLGFGVTTLSTTLAFGPRHALTWITPATLPGGGMGLLLALMAVGIGPRVAAGLGLVVLTALVGLVTLAPTDPYFAQNLAAWEYGRFIRFNGAAQWVGWLWPYATMAWLLGRLGERDPR